MNKNFSFAANEEIKFIYPDHSRILFYKSEYLNLRKELIIDNFYILNEAENRVDGHIQFEHADDNRISISHGTFGSLIMIGNSGYSLIYEFFLFIIDFYKQASVRSVIIRHYAGFYDPVNSPVIETSLMHLGFNITLCDINHHLKIKNSLFSDHINKMELRQLKKCIEAGLEVRQAKGNEAGKIYDIMTEFRTQKNIPITFSKDDFANSLEKMPENYTLFYVHDKQGEVIAATLMVRINDRVLYYFFPSDNPRRSSYSPMIMLMDGIFSYAKEHHYQYIDLGISSKNNTPQKGLIQFKENIGGLASVRLTFQLDIP